MTSDPVLVVGAGLAGCEAALLLGRSGVAVRLVDRKPATMSPAHCTTGVAELVCSNSFRSQQLENAVGLLKAELRTRNSPMIACADRCRIPAGGALAVDRILFSESVAQELDACESIERECRLVESIPDHEAPVILATGPLTSGGLVADLVRVTGEDSLFFYDAIAPIVAADSIDTGVVFAASRYGRGEPEDYLNVPLTRLEYGRFVEGLLAAPKVTPHDFEDSRCFEGCLPVEVQAARGVDVLAHGPMKPVGLEDPLGRDFYAVVQLRKEDQHGTSRNLVGFQTRLERSAQRDLFRSLPGMAGARFLRYGSIHRNTYVDAPRVLDDQLRIRGRDNLWLAGQLSGSEGYVEAITVGMLVADFVLGHLAGRRYEPPPPCTMMGGVYRHLRGSALGPFTPSNATWAMVPPVRERGGRRKRRQIAAQKAITTIERWHQSRLDVT